jgi:hypothetical protein
MAYKSRGTLKQSLCWRGPEAISQSIRQLLDSRQPERTQDESRGMSIVGAAT